MSLISELPKDLKKKFAFAHIAIFSMLAIGTIGFHYFEDLSWWESIYFTTATVTTVGYGDIVPKTRAGQQFTSVFILFGVGTVLYALSILAQSFIQKEVISILGNHRKLKEMRKLSNHYIVCGGGRVGRRIMKSLQKDDIPHILIEINEKKVELIQEGNKTFILQGDATNEKKLIEAGVERAKGLVTCLADDAKNVYVVLTARDLNKNLHIVSRAIEEQAEPKLIRAGANRVISPIIIGSQSMLRALTKPAIADFMESIVAENLDLVFDEIPISSKSEYANISLRNTNISSELKILVVAIRRGDGEMIFNPSASTKIIDKDLLIVIGKAESVKKLVEANQ